MKHPRNLIHVDREAFTDYGVNSDFIREIAITLQLRYKVTAGWSVEKVINEAFYQATALVFDFSTPIFFEADYFKEAVKKMPLSVANAVFSVVYVLIRGNKNMNTVAAMIENTLRTRPVFKSLRAIKCPASPVCLYPQTDYFSNALYVNWRSITNNFSPLCIQRVLDIADSYEYQMVLAEGMLGQLRSYALEMNQTQERYIADSEMLLKSYVGKDRVWEIYDGDGSSFRSSLGFNFIVGQTIVEGDPASREQLKQTEEELKITIEERNRMREYIAQLEIEQQKRLRETEEYKLSITEMKSQLGRSHISFNKIADCILRLPTYDLQYAAFQQVNALLTGTAWSEKAEDVLNQMFSKVKQQAAPTNINIETFNNQPGAVFNDNSNQSLPQSPNTPQIAE